MTVNTLTKPDQTNLADLGQTNLADLEQTNLADLEQTNLGDWEMINPLFNEDAFPDRFGKQFRESETWKHLLNCYPNTCLQHYRRWRTKIGIHRDPTPTEIGVFHWQIVHHYLPKINI
jgi:hypothetical protein